MKTMCPPGYHHNGFVATHAVGHHVPKYMSCHKAIVVITGRAHCFRGCIYILRSSCFYEIWAHCLSWIYKSTSGNLKNSVIVIVVMIIPLNSVSEYWQVKITILAEIKPQNNLK